MTRTLWQTELEGMAPPRRGKVRDIYDLGEHLLIVACDRISAYDHILQPGIPGKGRILNQLSNYWFERLGDTIGNHLVATRVADFPSSLQPFSEQLEGRSVLVRKAAVVPFECVARGYLAGSGFREYESEGTVCGIRLPAGLVRADRLPQPIYTPATKAEAGHDENVSFEVLTEALGEALAERLRSTTLALFELGVRHARKRGILLADTKFEFGHVGADDPGGDSGDRLILIDEVLTPDSSRFWERDQWRPGIEPISLDKQFVRNWLDSTGWDHDSPPPELPAEVVAGTLERYVEAFHRITGKEPEI